MAMPHLPQYELTHLQQLQPGARVVDRLRCRETVLEIISTPEETYAGMLGDVMPETGKPIVSSWNVQVRNLRTNFQAVTRIDCDETGFTNRFQLVRCPAEHVLHPV